jgi:tetratricopeptide (TPR) repeat protein
VIHSSKRVVLFLLSLLFGLLALGTKQNAATLPFFILLSEFFFFQPQSFKMDKKKLGFILLLGGLFVLISWIYLGSDFISRLALQYEQRGWTPIERMMTQWRVVIFYISLLIYPHPSRLNLDHDFSVSHSLFSPPTTIFSLLFIIGFLCLAIFSMRRNRLLAFAIFWFFGNLVIESSIIPLELVFEHRLYLPSMGLIILFSGFCFRISKREWERWVTALMILLIALFSYWTYERASVWRGPFSLWMDAAKKSPNKARPHNNLGTAYDKKGLLDEAITELKKSLIIKPDSAEAHTNLGVAYFKKSMLAEAISEHKNAIAINPGFADAYTNLGIAYGRKGLFDEAIAELKQSLACYPNNARAYYNLGYAYSKKGLLDDAISVYKKAIAINPYYTKAYNKLGFAFKAQGKLNDAIGSYRELIRLEPNNHEIYNELAWIYATSPQEDIRNGDEAVVLATRACELTGFKKSEALDTLAAAYAEKGKFDKAVEYQLRAIELAPSQIEKDLQKRLQLYKLRRAYRDQHN